MRPVGACDHPVVAWIAAPRELGARTPHTSGMAPRSVRVDNGPMATELTLERVRRDVEVIARGGLDTSSFVEELEATIQRAVPHVATCIATLDPASRLLTSTFKFGDLSGDDGRDHEWGLMEFGGADPTSFIDLIDGDVVACSMWNITNGDVARSPRVAEFLRPTYGYADELRMVARHSTGSWGGIALFRGPEDRPFSAEEVAFVGSLSADFATGLRSGLLARLARPQGGEPEPMRGPAVVIVDQHDRPSQVSMGAEALLRELTSEAHMSNSSGVIAALVATARRYASGSVDTLPMARARLPSGRWLVLHAAPLAAVDGPSGEVVITIEEARPPEIVPLVVAAFELTPRERDVTQLVLQGVETKDIAAALHMSRYTVQDHLKSVFDKAGVRSRRELIARIYFDQYVPRMGGELGPSGGFVGP